MLFNKLLFLLVPAHSIKINNNFGIYITKNVGGIDRSVGFSRIMRKARVKFSASA